MFLVSCIRSASDLVFVCVYIRHLGAPTPAIPEAFVAFELEREGEGKDQMRNEYRTRKKGTAICNVLGVLYSFCI